MKGLVSILNFVAIGALAAENQSIEPLVARCRDSVVVISHFGRDGKKEEGVGSGFVIASNLIGTAMHVIGESRRLSVRLAGGRELEATGIHAWDRKLDLAIIQVNAANLPALALGDSDKLHQGAGVIAIGNPLGLAHSVVQGVVSARRDIEGLEMIQIAIPIERGNSGGPLLDLEGRVQGILTMKSSLTRNLGFAVPVNALKKLIDHPNAVPMERWLTLASLNPREWTPLMGARWRQKNGQIHVEGMGKGFGGRSICLSQTPVPPRPFELAVSVRLDDESGAAGLIFGADESDEHFGFYPTAGQLRLTDFQGPNVFSWNILKTVPSDHYRPGEWNHIKVRVEKHALRCYINDHLVINYDEIEIPDGKVGLAKFRDTQAAFKDFEIGNQVKSQPADKTESLSQQAEKLEHEALRLRREAASIHRARIKQELLEAFDRPDQKVDLFYAALLLAKYDNPEVDVPYYQRQIDSMTKELRSRLTDSPVDMLIEYLFVENGFHGSRTDYYDRANSHMNEVMDDREGLPISLAVVFLELARRIGLKDVVGVATPGHFMIRHKDQLIDVFDGGKRLSRSQAEEVIGAQLLDRYLEPASNREIIVRMLRNLQNWGTSIDAARYQELINALSPSSEERVGTKNLP